MYSQTEQLIRMANQIGTFFESQSPTEPTTTAQSIVAHLKLFWAPTMRAQLVGDVDRGEAQNLLPVVESAVRTFRSILLVEQAHIRAEDKWVLPQGGGDAG